MDKPKDKSRQTTKRIAEKIRQLRMPEELTQEQFAEKTNLDRRTISRAECGEFRPANATLESISEVFAVPMSYFYDYSTIKDKQTDKDCINEILADLRVSSSENLRRIKKMIKVINE